MGHPTLDYAASPREGSRHVPWFVAAPLIALLLCFVFYQGGCFDEWIGRSVGTVARRTRTARDIEVLSMALDRFSQDTGRFPTTDEGLAALVTAPPGLNGWRGPYLRRVPTDPWGSAYSYRMRPSDDGAADYVVASAGPDVKLGTADDVLADDLLEPRVRT